MQSRLGVKKFQERRETNSLGARGFYLWLLVALMTLETCVPQNASDNSGAAIAVSTHVPGKYLSGSPTTTAVEGFDYSFAPVVDSRASLVVKSLPAWASFNPSSGVITGSPKGSGTFHDIELTATYQTAANQSEFTKIGPFSIYVYGDPLTQYTWHLDNSGQSSFSESGGSSGIDLNLTNTIKDNYTGNGVTVLVSDDGVEFAHPDLNNNLYVNKSKNYQLTGPNYIGAPGPLDSTDNHGTAVAGIIGAVGWNGQGSRGVAPEVLLASTNVLSALVNSAMQNVFILDNLQGDYDLFNYSYGQAPFPGNSQIDSAYEALIKQGFLQGRSGLGNNYVKAAGNSFYECDISNNFSVNVYNLGGLCLPHSANNDPENNNYYTIVVGAVNAAGKKSSYSSIGSSLWVAGVGGEYGYDKPAIVTTDRMGCNAGYSLSTNQNDFNRGVHSLNESCHYTSLMNGTSAATPSVTGALALILEANFNLTSRDVKKILAATSRKLETGVTSRSHYVSDANLSGHTWEQGWVTNTAGYSFNNYYGFGLVDVDAAVAMAKNYNANSMGALIQVNEDFQNSSYWYNQSDNTSDRLTIPDNSAGGVSSALSVSSNITVEAVEVKVVITHGRPGDLGIELTSPSGTKSILWNINGSWLFPQESGGSPVWSYPNVDKKLLTNAFYGETGTGTWTLKVIDGLPGDLGSVFDQVGLANQKGQLNSWAINIIGH